jgi:hypothetical protein
MNKQIGKHFEKERKIIGKCLMSENFCRIEVKNATRKTAKRLFCYRWSGKSGENNQKTRMLMFMGRKHHSNKNLSRRLTIAIVFQFTEALSRHGSLLFLSPPPREAISAMKFYDSESLLIDGSICE